MASESSVGDEGWPKWKVALAVGAPVALGLAGVWLYKRRISPSAVVKSEGLLVEDTTQMPQPQVVITAHVIVYIAKTSPCKNILHFILPKFCNFAFLGSHTYC